MSDIFIKVYSLSTCSHCKSVKKLMDDCDVKYDYVDVDLLKGEERKATLEDVRKYNSRCSFPTTIIGETVVVGYKATKVKEALNQHFDLDLDTTAEVDKKQAAGKNM